MSMGHALRVVRDHLRTQMSLSKDACRVVSGGEPPEMAPESFIGIDELGVDEIGNPDTVLWIAERFRFGVWVWRRAPQYPADRTEPQLIDSDPHLAGVSMPAVVERTVIKNIHGNQTLRAAVNTAIGAPHADNGDICQLPIRYRGRGPTSQRVISDGDSDGTVWYFRQLRFEGLDRVQAVDIME